MIQSTRKLITVDCDYVYPQFAAAFIAYDPAEGGNPAQAYVVETNTTHAVPKILRELKSAGLKPEDVKYVIITHVHLDHAGGASALMEACPNATLLAHPRAARHAIDPSKLIESAKMVYGVQQYQKLYGDIKPIPAERVRSIDDGTRIAFGAGELEFIHTRGHANHHFCVLDPILNTIFTGDAFGMAYPALQNQGLVIFPSTSPTDFDPVEAKRSVDRIAKSGVDAAALTHYGVIGNLKKSAEQLREHLDHSERLLHKAIQSPLSGKELNAWCEKDLISFFNAWAESKGVTLSRDQWDLIRLDLELNAAGIAFVAQKIRTAPKT